ncbi:MAG: flagellar biosynthetic protein FliR [Treponema sp.]|jgi:flagellar biosynthetic protein FliR|nr:flagellar biosynthetic protein FliR [Treponema sp.]
MLEEMLRYAPAFLLVAVRALAIIETAPLLSSGSLPQVVKISLAGFTAYASFNTALVSAWNFEPFGLTFIFLIIGEAIIGVIIGFYMTIVFSVFASAGQFFSLQMGFGASETFDPLAQIENPLMGQFLNMAAMLVFLTINGFNTLFLGGFLRSIQSLHVMDFFDGRNDVLTMMLSGLSSMFLDAFIISLPILGTLFLTSLATGLISKAAPQINILTEGFPISITVAFVIILASMPFMVEAFNRVIGVGFRAFEILYTRIGTAI